MTLALLVLVIAIADAVVHLRFADGLYRAVRRYPPHPHLQVLSGSQVDHVNPQGFRGDPVEEVKAAHTLRIFVLGGSTMLGVANPYAESFPALLQTRLAAAFPDRRFEVQNAATAWWSTAHTLVDYELRVRRYHPDLILVVHGINDLYRSFSPPAFASGPFQPDYGHYQGPYAGFKGPTATFNGDALPLVHAPFWPPTRWLVYQQARAKLTGAPRPFDNGPDNVRKLMAELQPRQIDQFRALPSFKNFCELLIARVRTDGVPIVVGSHPSLYRPDLDDATRALLLFAPVFANEDGGYPDLVSMTRGMAQFNGTARTIAAEQRIPFIDFAAVVPRTAEYFTDDVHLRKAGNEVLAETFGNWIAAHLKDGTAFDVLK